MNAVPVLIFWVLAAWGLTSKRPVLIYIFFGSMPFGSIAVLPPQLTAGLTFTPTPIVALLIIARALGNRRGIDFTLTSAILPNRLGLLFLFWLVAVFTTLFMPRLFAGHVYVIPMRMLTDGRSLLYPTTQNLSQLAYLTISVFAVFAFAKLFADGQTRQHALRAMCLGAALAVFTGVLDYASQYVGGLNPLLEPFRTATYALLTDVEVLGGKRVVGLMPEASAFGGLTLGFLVSLYFFRHAISDRRLRERYVPILLFLLAGFVWLSTSSAAYVGAAVFALLAGMEWLWRAFALGSRDRRRKGLKVELRLAFAGIFLLALVMLIDPNLLHPVVELVQRMIFDKTGSASYEQRTFWTAVSWQALLDTYGLGVGVGSTRASNAAVAVISNTGIVGAALFYGFLVQILLRRAPPGDVTGRAMISAVRWSIWPGLIIGLLAGTSADFGTFNAFRYGLIAAIAAVHVRAGYRSNRQIEDGLAPR